MGLILGIETSCDDTAAAVVSDDLEVLSTVVSRQVEAHARYGGIVPEVASRIHTSEVLPTVTRALAEAEVRPEDLDAIAVTRGPGLIGSLLVGVSTAKALALAWQKPLLGINHLEGHLASANLGDEKLELPCLVLLVSGGHCLLARSTAPGQYTLLGTTRDDSAGEAYDKVARALGLGFPGGPVLDRLAKSGTPSHDFPRPMIHDGLEFSFSGLKTAVSVLVRSGEELVVEDVAASFVDAVMDVLVAKTKRALSMEPYESLAVVGGVAASPILRERLRKLCDDEGVKLCLPPVHLATDNGAMIAAAAWPRFAAGERDSFDLSADPRLKLPTD